MITAGLGGKSIIGGGYLCDFLISQSQFFVDESCRSHRAMEKGKKVNTKSSVTDNISFRFRLLRLRCHFEPPVFFLARPVSASHPTSILIY